LTPITRPNVSQQRAVVLPRGSKRGRMHAADQLMQRPRRHPRRRCGGSRRQAACRRAARRRRRLSARARRAGRSTPSAARQAACALWYRRLCRHRARVARVIAVVALAHDAGDEDEPCSALASRNSRGSATAAALTRW